MEARIQKWGNSNGIRIPSNILKSLGLKTNDVLDLILEKNKIIISKQKKQHKTLEERIAEFEKLPDKDKGSIESYDWGNDLGKEKFY